MDLSMWDDVSVDKVEDPKFVPDEKGMTAVITEAGVHVKPETGYHGIFFRLYFPEYNLTETSFDTISNNEWNIISIKRKFKALKIATPKADIKSIEDAAKQSVGWTISVTKQTNKKPDGRIFRNFYFNHVLSKEQTKVPESATKSDGSKIPF